MTAGSPPFPSTGEDGWERFILANGWRTPVHWLAAVTGRPVEDIERVRRTGACLRRSKAHGFADLFSLWNGRPPRDEDWPAPRKSGGHATYEWLVPELVLLGSLVGTLGAAEIAQVLTARLRQITGDTGAARSPAAIITRIHALGLQTSDVLGGLTTQQAGREVNSLSVVHQAIAHGQLPARRVGRLWVIGHEDWAAWKATRVFPPDGYVPLSTLRKPLAIRSDKLSEFARLGQVPTAIRCTLYGTKHQSTQFGTWYLDAKVAQAMIADRQAGRPMPWHGKPKPDNLRISFRLWCERKHPTNCETCAGIWGPAGPPATFEDYERRYPPLAFGAKRHLTRPWHPGLTVQELAARSGRSASFVRQAIKNGMLASAGAGQNLRVSRTDATRWIYRNCPTGDGEKSWLSLATAAKQYLFSPAELEGHIASGALPSKTGSAGASPGVVFVPRHLCARLRETIGFTEQQAAQRVGVTVAELRKLLEGVNWRQAEGIPLSTVQAAISRRQSRSGYTVEEAAAILQVAEQQIHELIKGGAAKLIRTPWDDRSYITEPMLRRLRQAVGSATATREVLGEGWLSLGDAALEAGVCTTTVIRWSTDGELERQKSNRGWRYHRDAVRVRARQYWETVRFHRAVPPSWLVSGSVQEISAMPHVEPPPLPFAPSFSSPAEGMTKSPRHPLPDSVEAAIEALSQAGLTIIKLKGSRYLIDGIQSWSEEEVIEQAHHLCR